MNMYTGIITTQGPTESSHNNCMCVMNDYCTICSVRRINE